MGHNNLLVQVRESVPESTPGPRAGLKLVKMEDAWNPAGIRCDDVYDDA